MIGDASFSPCGLYRYSLSRVWGPGPRVAWIMLNPSTADANTDDPTIRRCIAFAREWAYDGIEVVNLFAYRSPDPQDLVDSREAGIDIIGPENDAMIRFCVERSKLCVAAWGAHRIAQERAEHVWLPQSAMHRLHCLGTTQSGAPRHPLYCPKDSPLMGWPLS